MSTTFAELRDREFGRLDSRGQVYLDYTGSGLYAESQVRAHARLLENSVLGNPHSRNPTSSASTRLVEDARARVLAHLDADPDEYAVVFTLNASAALKLVGESFPFGSGGRCVLTADNHNSVHGIREFAEARGAEVTYAPLDDELRVPDIESHLTGSDTDTANLLVYPTQSNFSGVKHPAEWVKMAHEHGYRVLLDAAAFVPTSRLSLRTRGPDFVAISFYKMFGFPTGVGALIASREALAALHRPWFGGGTVRFVSVRSRMRLLHASGRAFEDGTLNFLSIAAVSDGLDFLESVGVDRIGRHVGRLTDLLLRELKELRWPDGQPLIRLYGPRTADRRGGGVAFNVLDEQGRAVDFREVERRAGEHGISLRGGYFCNPGAAEYAFGQTGDEIDRCLEGATTDSYDIERFSLCMQHKPVGAVRVSLGIASNEHDIRRLVEVLTSFGEAASPPHRHFTRTTQPTTP